MRKSLLLFLLLITGNLLKAQNVGIGTTTPNTNAALEIRSNDKGLLMPRVSNTAKNSMSNVAKGMLVYDTTYSTFFYHDGGKWRPISEKNSDSLLINYADNPQVTANMNSGASTSAQSGLLYDNGGPAGNYAANSNDTYTISSQSSDSIVGFKVIIEQMNTEAPYDSLEIYTDYEGRRVISGTTTGTYYFPASAYLVLKFRSNGVNQNAGFRIRWSVLTLGTSNIESPPLYGWYFNARKMAMRGGMPMTNDWSADSLGKYSFAFGFGAKAKGIGSVAFADGRALGDYSVALGWSARATGYGSIAIGPGYYYYNSSLGVLSTAVGNQNSVTSSYGNAFGAANSVSGEDATAVGVGNTAMGEKSVAISYSAAAEGDRSIAMGNATYTKAYASTALGIYNEGAGAFSTTTWVATEPLFMIGNGTANASRSNAMMILKNGNVGIGTNTPTVKLEVNNSDALIHGITVGRGGSAHVYNTAFGIQALVSNTTGHSNAAAGTYAMQSNTTGYYNTAMGYSSLNENTVGISNTAIGTSALRTNKAGNNAVAIGTNAMYYANSTATPFTNRNVAVGYEALRGSNTPADNTGNNNVSIGYESMQLNTAGSDNIAVGYQALSNNNTGDNNTAIGYVALIDNTTGHSNTSIGYGSINNNTTGNYNTALGRSAYFDLTGLDNTTCIGANSGGIVDVSNRIEIGNTSVTAIAGQVSFSTYSDGRMKDNITADVPGLSFITRLRPVSYNLNIHRQNDMVYGKERKEYEWASKYDIEKIRMTGFIAQEVEQAAKEINFDFSGVQAPKNTSELYSLRYSDFVMPLVKAVQEQQAIINNQQQEISDLRKRLEKLESLIK